MAQKTKQVRTYTRRTKSGKTVTVRAHSARYNAAKDCCGSGKEFEKKINGLTDDEWATFDGEKFSPEVEAKIKKMTSKRLKQMTAERAKKRPTAGRLKAAHRKATVLE